MDLINFGKPDGGELDWSDSLAQEIGFYAVPGLGDVTDYVNGTSGILFAGSLTGSTQAGPGFQSTSNTAHGLYWPFPNAFDPIGDRSVQDFTIAVYAEWVSWPAFGKMLCFPYRQNTTWSTPFTSLSFQDSGSGTTAARIDTTNTSDTANNSSAVSNFMVTGRPAAYVVTRSGTGATFFRDGQQIGTATLGSALAVTFRGLTSPTRPNLYICQRNHQNTGEGCQATVLAAALWPRVLSGDEIQRWSADPFGLIRPRSPALTYVTLTASASGDVTVSLGLLEATGAILDPTVSGGASYPAAILGADGAILTPTVSAGAVYAASLLSATAEQLTPTASGGANVSTAVLSATGEILAPTVTGNALVSLGIVEATAELLGVTVQTGGNITVAAGLLEATAEPLAPTVSASASTTVGLLTASAELLTPTTSGGALVSLGLLEASAELLGVTVSIGSGNVTISVGVLEASAELLAAVVSTGTFPRITSSVVINVGITGAIVVRAGITGSRS